MTKGNIFIVLIQVGYNLSKRIDSQRTQHPPDYCNILANCHHEPKTLLDKAHYEPFDCFFAFGQ